MFSALGKPHQVVLSSQVETTKDEGLCQAPIQSSHMGWYFKEGGTNIVNMDATFHIEHILKKTSPHQSSWTATVSSRTMILSTHAGW